MNVWIAKSVKFSVSCLSPSNPKQKMTLTGGDIFSRKFHSVEAVRVSLQQIWESCLPRKKIHQPVITQQNQYFLPDLDAPVFFMETEDLLRLTVRDPIGLYKLEELRKTPATLGNPGRFQYIYILIGNRPS